MSFYLGVFVVSAWSGLDIPKPQGLVSGHEAVFQRAWIAINRETVVIGNRNKYRQSRFVVPREISDLIGNEKVPVFASENWSEVAQVNMRIDRPSGKLTVALDPLKASGGRSYPCGTLAKISIPYIAARGTRGLLQIILRHVVFKQPSSFSASGNFNLLPNGEEQKGGNEDIGQSQNDHSNVCDSYVGRHPSDRALSLAYMFIAGALVLLGLLVSYGLRWGYLGLGILGRTACIAGGLLLFVAGFILGLFGLSIAQCAYGTH
jgi:hypothetical protein